MSWVHYKSFQNKLDFLPMMPDLASIWCIRNNVKRHNNPYFAMTFPKILCKIQIRNPNSKRVWQKLAHLSTNHKMDDCRAILWLVKRWAVFCQFLLEFQLLVWICLIWYVYCFVLKSLLLVGAVVTVWV